MRVWVKDSTYERIWSIIYLVRFGHILFLIRVILHSGPEFSPPGSNHVVVTVPAIVETPTFNEDDEVSVPAVGLLSLPRSPDFNAAL